MINPDRHPPFNQAEPNFWQRLLSDRTLQQCENLEKLIIGCELIAALDDSTMLAQIAA
ncbi:MAG: hypothetical protein ABI946_11390 [Chthoniobacterales bacterium]